MIDKIRKVNKPWGSELIWAETKDYVGKYFLLKKITAYLDSIVK